MSLNIKNEDAHKLAKALQQATGETMTEAVTVALRERLQRVRRRSKSKSTSAELLAIGRRCAAALRQPPSDHADLLYDERGLPR